MFTSHLDGKYLTLKDCAGIWKSVVSATSNFGYEYSGTTAFPIALSITTQVPTSTNSMFRNVFVILRINPKHPLLEMKWGEIGNYTN
uniref:Uncharacterized protein n=1 Tax=Megaselia scalaris TaxID=36166 RepID=T1GYS4_MEGSC